MAESVLFQPLEALLQRKIAASTPARRQLRALEGRVLAIRVRDSSLQLFLSAEESGIRIGGDYRNDPDVIIEGTIPALAGVSLAKTRPLLRSDQLTITGDASVAADFRELLRLAQPDWEEELSRLVGDVAAHQIGNLARDTLRWSKQAIGIFSTNIREFLQEESRDLPTRIEVEHFLDEVDELHQASERAELRLERIENKRPHNGNSD